MTETLYCCLHNMFESKTAVVHRYLQREILVERKIVVSRNEWKMNVSTTHTLCIRWKQMISQFVVNCREKRMLSFGVHQANQHFHELWIGNRLTAIKLQTKKANLWTWKLNIRSQSFINVNQITAKKHSESLIVDSLKNKEFLWCCFILEREKIIAFASTLIKLHTQKFASTVTKQINWKYYWQVNEVQINRRIFRQVINTRLIQSLIQLAFNWFLGIKIKFYDIQMKIAEPN